MTASHVPADYGLVFEEPPAPRTAPAKRQPGYIAPDSHRPHGSYVKYVIERCTCEPCRAANRAYERNRQRAMARPDQAWVPYVPAAPARQHLLDLRAAGIGPKTVAKISGVPHGTLAKLIYGDRSRGMGPSKRVRPETEFKILCVSADQAAGGQRVPAGPTWQLLDDLISRGFTKAWIAGQLGATSPALQVSHRQVRASTARKVERLHRRLEGVDAPPRRTRWST